MRKSLIKICVIYVLVLSLTIANSKYIIMDIGNDPYATSGSLITSNEIETLKNVKKIGFIEVNDEEKIEKVYFFDDKKYQVIEEFKEGDTINIDKFKEFNQKSIEEYNKFRCFGIPCSEPEIYNEDESELWNFIKYLYRASTRIVVLTDREYLKYFKLKNNEEKVRLLKEKIKDEVMYDTSKKI